MKMSMLILTEIGRMKVSQLIEWLSLQDKDDDVTFYYLKNDTLTNCQLETIIETDMGVEFTIQDTSELLEEAV
jgi:hypothetical protein